MERRFRVICPYCGFTNSFMLTEGRHIVFCDIVEGGCDGMFVVNMWFEIRHEVYRIEGQSAPKAEGMDVTNAGEAEG